MMRGLEIPINDAHACSKNIFPDHFVLLMLEFHDNSVKTRSNHQPRYKN